MSSVTYNFISNQRRPARVLVAANATHIFCVDDKELHIFNLDMEFWKKVALPRQIFFAITCSNDGSVTAMSSNRGQFTRFWLNEASEYVSTDFNQNGQDVSGFRTDIHMLI